MTLTLVHSSDLHYGHRSEGDASAERMAKEISQKGGDALILTGDLAIRNPDRLRDCLNLFAGFEGHKLFVAGNHDLWSPPFSAMERYEQILPEIGAECGFHFLDKEPFVSGSTAFVGTIGWYDYEYRFPDLEVDFSCYEQNSWPGVASWNDKHWITWEYTDLSFTEHCCRRLEEQLDEVRDNAETIVACLHHIPFKEVFNRKPDKPAWAFCRAFMGSPAFGEILLKEEKVSTVLCGHIHRSVSVKVGHIQVYANGSTYNRKEYHVIEI